MVPPTSELDRFAAGFPWSEVQARPRRWALHIALFVLTFLTTTAVGAGLARSFAANHAVDLDLDLAVLMQIPANPRLLIEGLPFSVTLLTILLAHEMGHYITCLRYGIDASLPFFLPAPTLIGTLGAFIRIRSPIYTRRALFDVGVAGPIAGFVALVPALIVGLAQSKVLHGIASHGDLIFGTPLAIRIIEWLFFPGVPVADISLHPVARAAWVGLLATALNLLPIGQLDGGHIMYSFFGEKHRILSRIFVVILGLIGPFFAWSWFVWAVILALFGLRHPAIYDQTKLGPVRTRIGWFALAMFLLSFTLAPIRSGS